MKETLEKLVKTKRVLFEAIKEGNHARSLLEAGADIEKKLSRFEISSDNPEGAVVLLVSRVSFLVELGYLETAIDELNNILNLTKNKDVEGWVLKKKQELLGILERENEINSREKSHRKSRKRSTKGSSQGDR